MALPYLVIAGLGVVEIMDLLRHRSRYTGGLLQVLQTGGTYRSRGPKMKE